MAAIRQMQIEVFQTRKELNALTTPVAGLSGKLDRLAVRVMVWSHISTTAAVAIKSCIAKKASATLTHQSRHGIFHGSSSS